MALTPIPVPPFPNVPNAPGVPPVLRGPAQAPFVSAGILVADAIQIFNMFQPPQWGVFDNKGKAVFVADSVASIDHRSQSRLATYPMEEGAFQTYDKVALPHDSRVRFIVAGTGLLNSPFFAGGSLPKRALFLNQLKFAAQSLELFTIRTPEIDIKDVNIVNYDYRRTRDGGTTIILVDVWFQEVRATATTQFSNTKEPEGAADQSGGTVQPTPVAPVAPVTSTPLPSQVGDLTNLPPGDLTPPT